MHALFFTLEQRQTELLLQLPDLAAQRGLRDMKLAGRFANVFVFGYGDEVTQQTQIHG
jgi:hypothetical protein